VKNVTLAGKVAPKIEIIRIPYQTSTLNTKKDTTKNPDIASPVEYTDNFKVAFWKFFI